VVLSRRMTFELLPNEVILDIFDHVIKVDNDITKKLYNIYNISLTCRIFHSVVTLHPIMSLVRKYKESHENYDSLRVMRIFSDKLVETKIIARVNDELRSILTPRAHRTEWKPYSNELYYASNGFILIPSGARGGCIFTTITPQLPTYNWTWRADIIIRRDHSICIRLLVKSPIGRLNREISASNNRDKSIMELKDVIRSCNNSHLMEDIIRMMRGIEICIEDLIADII
jgi:hypothetical protein